MQAIIAPIDRQRVCHRCRERPAGCWQARAFASPAERLKAMRLAVIGGTCPMGKWGGEPLPGELAGSEVALDAMFADPAATLWPASHKGPVDVVYFLSHLSKNRDDWELRHSLRSIVANFPDLGRVFIVGHRPAWIQGVEHLGVPDYHTRCKDANLYAKLLAAARWGVSDWFLNPSDDQLLLRPLPFADCRAWHVGNMARYGMGFWQGQWKQRLLNTFNWLRAHGCTTYHHDGHVPMPIHRDSFLANCTNMPYNQGHGFTVHTGYFNTVPIPKAPLGAQKHTQGHACRHVGTIERALMNKPRNIETQMENKLFCGYNNAGLTPEFQSVISRRFPRPSPYEADQRTQVAVSIDLDPMRRRREAFDAMIGFPHREPSHNPPPCTLLFHFAPWRGRPEMIDFHIRQLAQYLPQFGKVRMSIVTGPEFADPKRFIEPRILAAARPGADVQFFHVPHAKENGGENLPFFKYLLPSVEPGEHVCYAHSKGAMASPLPRGRFWAELMYRAVLGNVERPINLLQRYPCVGSLKSHRCRHTHARWCYAGTFFWFHGSDHAKNPYRSPSRYAVEAWPGSHIPERQAPDLLSHRVLGRQYTPAIEARYLALPWHPMPPASSAEPPSPAEPADLPRLSIIIPTIGRATLARTLATIAAQELLPGDEVLVIGDGPQPEAERMFQAAGLPGRYLDGPTRHNWGGRNGPSERPRPAGTSSPTWTMTTFTRPALSPRSARTPIGTP